MKKYLAEAESAHKEELRESAQQRTEEKHKAPEERAAKAEEAAHQRQEANEAAIAHATEAAKQSEQLAATAAKKLVEAWKEEPVEASSENVLAIEKHLISLGGKCEQSIPTLANEIDVGVEILRKAAIAETPVELAAAFDTAAPGKKVTAGCAEILSALIALIEKGE
jgi:hypothetical protein